jgi:hypothetical protein
MNPITIISAIIGFVLFAIGFILPIKKVKRSPFFYRYEDRPLLLLMGALIYLAGYFLILAIFLYWGAQFLSENFYFLIICNLCWLLLSFLVIFPPYWMAGREWRD